MQTNQFFHFFRKLLAEFLKGILFFNFICVTEAIRATRRPVGAFFVLVKVFIPLTLKSALKRKYGANNKGLFSFTGIFKGFSEFTDYFFYIIKRLFSYRLQYFLKMYTNLAKSVYKIKKIVYNIIRKFKKRRF